VALLLLLVGPPFLMAGEALVRARLEPLSTDGAALRVYARPFTLVPGERPDRAAVQNRLERLGYRRTRGQEVGIGQYYLGSRGWIIGRRPFRGAGEPIPQGFAVIRLDYTGQISRMEDEDGRRLALFSLEPELIGRVDGGAPEDRLPVRLDEVPEQLVQALLTVEDQRFFEHGGLDLRRIGAAFVANFKAGQVVQGGSTLTQQLAKNLFLTPRRSVVRKLREAFMAVTLERRYSKQEILQAYLNHVYLGQDGAVGIHGVGRASQYFFGKDVVGLDLAESALLVALIRAPSPYSPLRHPDKAVERRNLVLRLMLERGSISEEEYEAAEAAPLSLREAPAPPRSARYFVDFVAAHVRETDGGGGDEGLPEPVWIGGTEGNRGASHATSLGQAGTRGLVTTLDLDLQRVAEEAVRTGLARLERDFDWLREGEDGRPLQAALVALDPRTGEILAMVGGRDYGESQFNRAVYAHRQPGSAFKPVVALAALARGGESGQPAFTLASVLQDEPFQVETAAGLWQPANYDRNFRGPVTLRDALERSLNVPFARLGLAVGPERIVEAAKRMGVESPLSPYPSLALGASEVSPLELTRAFGVLAADGFRADLKVLFDGPNRGTQVYDPAETYLVTSALRGAVERGTGKGIRDRGFYGDVAAKSGTTNDYRDGWFIGYTPSMVVGVWVGFDRGKRLELPGASLALPIFTDFLSGAVGTSGREGRLGTEGFSYPSGLEMVNVDPLSGLRGGWGCSGEPELFLRGTAPDQSCGGFRIGDGFRVGDEFRVDAETLRRLLEDGSEEVVRALRRLLSGARRR